jgi:hypothetical protein
MRRTLKKLTLNRETLHALEWKHVQGGTVYTTQPYSCGRTCTRGTSCTYDSCCHDCIA